LQIERACSLWGSRPEFECGEVGCPSPHSLADVVPSDHQVAAIVAFATDNDVDMGIIGVPMIDANPIEPRAEIAFSLRHQLSRE